MREHDVLSRQMNVGKSIANTSILQFMFRSIPLFGHEQRKERDQRAQSFELLRPSFRRHGHDRL
jgi:hypothetical protein